MPAALALCAGLLAQTSRLKELRGSKHDFSASSPADIRAVSEQSTCLFCHTPHRANPTVPLWNKSMQQGTTYDVYSSSTLEGSSGSPGVADSSRLCLSCHDGTVALGDTVNNGVIPFQNVPTDQKLPPGSPGNLAGSSLTLAYTHPVANTWPASSTQVHVPPSGDEVRLDASQKIQCTTCHDPHNERKDPTSLSFLIKNNSSSAICVTCHSLSSGASSTRWSWDGSLGPRTSHATAPNTYNASTNGGVTSLGAHTGYTTTATNGCASCHRAHSAVQTAFLVKGRMDQVCFQCHDGNPATGLPSVSAAFNKRYTHPSTETSLTHDPSEAPNNITDRHATCGDCHNAHAARADTVVLAPPQLSTALLGVSGISADGLPRDPFRGSGDSLYEYETCFKCHSYNPNQPQALPYYAYGPMPRRQIPSTNLQAAFASNASFHPVTRPRGLTAGPGGVVASLLPSAVDVSGAPLPRRQLTSTSQLYCSDCHNSNTGRNTGGGGNGAQGPHGSDNEHILERRYLMEDPGGAVPGSTLDLAYSSSNYALCYKCHSESSLLSENSSFPKHKDHMEVTSCATCHDPHGVPNGSMVSNASLINFDLRIVAPYGGVVSFQQAGLHHGSCTLTCHGVDHDAESY